MIKKGHKIISTLLTSQKFAHDRPLDSSKSSAFTLIEVLVSLVISGIMLTLVTSSYWLFLKVHKKAAVSRELQQETRFAMTRMADKIRAYNINYQDYESGGACPPSQTRNYKLCLNDHTISFHENNVWLDEHPLFSIDKFTVETAYFEFSPEVDPLKNIGNLPAQIQPKTTVFLHLTSKKFPDTELKVQTTLSSRKYNQ